MEVRRLERLFRRPEIEPDPPRVRDESPGSGSQVFDTFRAVVARVEKICQNQGEPGESLGGKRGDEELLPAMLDQPLQETPGLEAAVVAQQDLPSLGRLLQELGKPGPGFGPLCRER